MANPPDHWGKIACHFPNRGNPNLDVTDIEFLKKNDSSTVKIDRVYMVPPGVTITSDVDLQPYIVWTTDLKLKQLGDPITIEYTPPEDMPLTDIAIFTTDDVVSTSINFAIFHESGLVVAKNNGDTITPTTFFGTQGYRRNTTVSGVTLKKGYKYYIQYTNSNNDFKSTAMDGWVGKYLKWTHTTAQDKSVANINNTVGYAGSISTVGDFIAADANKFFLWTGGTSYNTSNKAIYIRNNLYHNTYSGEFGSGNLTINDFDTLLNLDDNTLFGWVGNDKSEVGLKMNQIHFRNDTLSKANYKGIVQDRVELIDPSYSIGDYVSFADQWSNFHIYRKTENLSVDGTMNFSDYSSYSTRVQAATLITKSRPSPSGEIGSIMTYGQFFGSSKNGNIYTFKSGYTYDFTLVNNVLSGYTLSNPPSSYITNCVYYLEENGAYNGPWANAGLNLWTGSAWTIIAEYDDNLSQIFDIITDGITRYTEEVYAGTAFTRIGDLPELASQTYKNTYISETIRSETVYTDQKYYLKLNDVEV